MRLLSPSLLLCFLHLPLHISLAQTTATPPVTLECDNTSLTTYLLSLPDLLYANGLTVYEDLLMAVAQSDDGYDKLLELFSAPSVTLLVPTDSAFHDAGIGPPFPSSDPNSSNGNGDGQGKGGIVDVFAFHALQGNWDKMAAGTRGVASTLMTMKEGMGGDGIATTGSGGASASGNGNGGQEAYQAMVLQRGNDDDGKISIRMAVGNGTTWSGPLDMSGHEVLSNLVVMPVDKVISFPPPLSSALTLPTCTRSAQGFPKFAKAFTQDQVHELEKLHPGGFTLFAVVDDGIEGDWGGNIQAHYTTNYSLFSPMWAQSSFQGITLDSGDHATVKQNEDGTYVSLGTGDDPVDRMILRSDIVLQNGVMHIIDGPLLQSPNTNGANSMSDKSEVKTTNTNININTNPYTKGGSTDSSFNPSSIRSDFLPESSTNTSSPTGISYLTSTGSSKPTTSNTTSGGPKVTQVVTTSASASAGAAGPRAVYWKGFGIVTVGIVSALLMW